MYYLNIADNDVKQLHGQVYVDKTFTLGEIQNSDYFKIEEITDTLLKIIPLFYCEEISTTNEDDVVIDDQCILANYNEDTQFTFTSPPNLVKEILVFKPHVFEQAVFMFFDKATLKPLQGVQMKSTSDTYSSDLNVIFEDKVITVDPTFDTFEEHDATVKEIRTSDIDGMVMFNDISVRNYEIEYQYITTTLWEA